MPGKIKSSKQFKLLEAAAHGGLKSAGPSKKAAAEMLASESESKKKKFAKAKK